MSKYIDIHAHLNSEEFDSDLSEVVSRIRDQEMLVINVGTDLQSSKKAVSIAEEYNDVCYAIIGIHPHEAFQIVNDGKLHEEISSLEEMIKKDSKKKIVGIGECGLDYFKLETLGSPEDKIKSAQDKLFRAQIELAIKYNLPVMIHARDSYDNILEILKEYLSQDGVELRGNVHFFAGTAKQADAFLGCGFSLSFTGVITFAKQYEEIIQMLPITSILSETDCPFVAPVPYRGKRAEPVHVVEVVRKIAMIKGLSEEEVKDQIYKNARDLFCL